MSSKENYCFLWIEIVVSCQKVPKSYFQSQFWSQKLKDFLFKFQFHFRRPFFGNKFFSSVNFWTTLLLKSCPNLDKLTFIDKNFLIFFVRVCWFLAKKFAFYDPTSLKFHKQSDNQNTKTPDQTNDFFIQRVSYKSKPLHTYHSFCAPIG